MINKTILEEPLNSKYIKQRKEGYGQVGYIETQHAIREANRAFNFEWSQQTLEMNLVQNEQKEKVKKNPNDPTIMLHYIGYTCKVVVKVDDIQREGYGFGQGIDRDLGKAHESATKEAESDAIKRALRTFGDIFGLALYDKTHMYITNADETVYQVISNDDITKLENLMEKKGSDKKALLAHYDILRLNELSISQYQQIKSMLEKREDKKDDKIV